MNFWSFVYDILDFTTWLARWRFAVCFFLGAAVASAAYHHIATDPFRWMAGGAILLVATYIGLRWDGGSD
jgi:hypothetical protein